MKYWKQPKDEHIVYEALTAISSDRMKKENDFYKCFSSSGNKFYTINFNLENMQFMSDDNMAYYRDEVSYPILAILLIEGVVSYDKNILKYFKDVPWKDINQKNRNDYIKSVSEFLDKCENSSEVERECKDIFTKLLEINIGVLGVKRAPPKAY